MWKKLFPSSGSSSSRGGLQAWRILTSRQSSSSSSSRSAVDSIILRSLKEHYLEVSKMPPPPKVSPPSPYSIVKGALDSSSGPVLQRTYGEEEISISVMRLANIIPGGGGDDDAEDEMNQLFLHVDVSKPGNTDSLHFLCGLYTDALGIHSISMRPKIDPSHFLSVPKKYCGPTFQDLDERTRDALHGFMEERGVNESLFTFLQAWLYVKDHRNLMRWFKTVGSFISENKSA